MLIIHISYTGMISSTELRLSLLLIRLCESLQLLRESWCKKVPKTALKQIPIDRKLFVISFGITGPSRMVFTTTNPMFN